MACILCFMPVKLRRRQNDQEIFPRKETWDERHFSKELFTLGVHQSQIRRDSFDNIVSTKPYCI